MTKDRPLLILIDGSSYFFRAFHALPPLINKNGQATGAIYGVANMVRRLQKDYPGEHIAVVFDAPGKTFRDELYPEYKAHRPPVPAELSSQFIPLTKLIIAMGLPLYIIDGVEADDVIGTLAAEACHANMRVIISTSDKDMAQLVNDNVTLMNTMSNQTLTIDGVKEKFGVFPEQIIDYLTLMGDTSDNVPGVKQCGPKTAVKWLNQYQTLDNLVQHADEISGKIGESLRTSLNFLPLSKQLVTIKTDLTLPISLDELHLHRPNYEDLIQLCRDLEFKTWLKELLEKSLTEPRSTAQHTIVNETNNTQTGGIATLSATQNYTIVHTQEALNDWLTRLKQAPLVCIDTETTSLNTLEAQLVGISMAIEENDPIYIPLAHTDTSIAQLDREAVLAQLKPLLENPALAKLGQNLKYDYNIFKNYQIDLQGIRYDTMLESYVLNSNAGRHDMDSLALNYLGYKTISYEEVAGKGAKQIRFDEVPISRAAPYAAEDADITLKLHHALYPQLNDKLQALLHDIEIPLLTVLADMERHGVLIDKNTLEIHGKRLKERLIELEAEALTLAGQPFNLNSPKQLQDVLFGQLKLPVISKTPTGQASTAESVLQELAYDYRLPAVILEYRSLSKLVSTYIDALPKRINPSSLRVHTSYNQAVTATGRLSSSDPNLQNIPIRSEEGRLIRRAFIAPKGCVLLAADYSQIELRIMAHLSQDPNLLLAFANDWDIHTATASEIFFVNQSEVSHEQRRRAKAVNFGLIYGMSAFGLAKQLGVGREEAQHYINRYFERYPGVLDYMQRTRSQAHEQGFVETLFGRRLHLADITSSNMMRKKAAERTAINAPMQGTAADIIKKAMIAIHDWEKSQASSPAHMIMQVHDELVFEIEEHAVNECRETLRQFMEHVVELSVPLKVSIGVGPNWDEAH